MKKIASVLLCVLAFLFLGAAMVNAQAITEVNFPNPLTSQTFGEFIEKIIDFIFIVAFVMGPLMIMIGAWYMVTAGGAAENIKKGKEIIKYVIIGLILLMLAKGIIMAINKAFGVIS